MRHSAKAAAAMLLSATAFAAEPQAEALGRLFFTPEQRAALDRQRRLDVGRTSVDRNKPVVVFDGEVSRSDGRRIRWINGVPVEGEIALPAGAESNPLKVGEAINSGTGERQDLLNGGRIVIRKVPPASP